MTTGSNNPETPQATRSATTVTVAGTDYEYANMPVAEGLEIYSKLPANYQQMADVYAALAKRFQKKLDIKLPDGMSFTTAWENTVKAVQSGTGMDKAPDYQKEIYAQFRDQLDQVPVLGTAADVAETGATLTGMGVSAGKGFVNGMLVIPRILGAGVNIAGEVKDKVVGAVAPVTDDQAKAFGAAMAGAALYQGAERAGMTTGSKLWNYPGSSIGAAAEWTTLNVPVLNSVWPYIQACFQMVQQWASVKDGEAKKSFSDFVAENKADAEAKRSSGEATYDALFERRARSGELDAAGDIMRKAKKVAGLDTVPLIDVAEEGGAIKSADGTASTVTNEDGKGPKIDDGVAVEGQNTTTDRILTEAKKPFLPILDGMKAEHGLLAGAAATAGATYGVKKTIGMAGPVAEGTKVVGGKMSQLARGAAAGYYQGTADMIGGSAFRKSHSLLNERDALQGKHTKLAETIKDLEEKENKGRFGKLSEKLHEGKISRAEGRLARIASKLETVDEAIKHGPAFSGSRWGVKALEVSDKAGTLMGEAATATSKLGRVARGAGRVAPWMTAGFFAKDLWDTGVAWKEGDDRKLQESAASAGVVGTGAAVGAGIGVWFGGVGAIPGAIIGGGVAGAADFVGGLFGYGSKDIAGRHYDANHRPSPKQIEAARMKEIVADPDMQAFVEAVQARDPEAMKMLVGNSEAARNARLVLKASGVKADAGAWISEEQLVSGGAKPAKSMSLAAAAASLS